MKKITIILAVLILIANFVVAVEIPTEQNTVVINKVDQEHKNTRQFISNEFTRRQDDFLKQLTVRGDYYESAVNEMLRTGVIKLTLAWMGVVFFVVSLNHLISNRTEKKRYGVLKDSIMKDIRLELMPELIKLPPEVLQASLYKDSTKQKEPVKKYVKPFRLFQKGKDKKADKTINNQKEPIEQSPFKSGVIQKMKFGNQRFF